VVVDGGRTWEARDTVVGLGRSGHGLYTLAQMQAHEPASVSRRIVCRHAGQLVPDCWCHCAIDDLSGLSLND
jgi:hypothetical protein